MMLGLGISGKDLPSVSTEVEGAPVLAVVVWLFTELICLRWKSACNLPSETLNFDLQITQLIISYLSILMLDT